MLKGFDTKVQNEICQYLQSDRILTHSEIYNKFKNHLEQYVRLTIIFNEEFEQYPPHPGAVIEKMIQDSSTYDINQVKELFVFAYNHRLKKDLKRAPEDVFRDVIGQQYDLDITMCQVFADIFDTLTSFWFNIQAEFNKSIMILVEEIRMKHVETIEMYVGKKSDHTMKLAIENAAKMGMDYSTAQNIFPLNILEFLEAKKEAKTLTDREKSIMNDMNTANQSYKHLKGG